MQSRALSLEWISRQSIKCTAGKYKHVAESIWASSKVTGYLNLEWTLSPQAILNHVKLLCAGQLQYRPQPQMGRETLPSSAEQWPRERPCEWGRAGNPKPGQPNSLCKLLILVNHKAKLIVTSVVIACQSMQSVDYSAVVRIAERVRACACCIAALSSQKAWCPTIECMEARLMVQSQADEWVPYSAGLAQPLFDDGGRPNESRGADWPSKLISLAYFSATGAILSPCFYPAIFTNIASSQSLQTGHLIALMPKPHCQSSLYLT